MNLRCSVAECTVADTGICVQENSADSCPNLLPTDGAASEEVIKLRDLPQRHQAPRFAGGFELGLDSADQLLAERYGHLIGILGSPKAGKTAALISLYLLLSRGQLKGYRFLDSYSLMAFEGLSRGARRWNHGSLPSEICGHTILADSRSPGFLHLRIKDEGRSLSRDLLLPDLPGEWTDMLVNKRQVERLAFLKRADAFWIVFHGKELMENRQHSLHRFGILLDRLQESLIQDDSVPIVFVLTHADELTEPLDAVWIAVQQQATERKLHIRTVAVASLSAAQQIQPGHGIADLLDAVFDGTPNRATGPSRILGHDTRSILRFEVEHE